ncbi:glycosyltransferase [Sphingomonas sp. 1P06PA]|uniref:glycosyltransferase n=1 Tax=Sphingomonas sp. 1P06PA TaxID=554121 RepID=UPI0039A680A3
MNKPIFYDASGRRALYVRMLLLAAVASGLALLVALGLTVSGTSPRSAMRFAEDAARPTKITSTAARVAPGPWLTAQSESKIAPARELFAFYMPWDEASRRALVGHVGEVSWLVPGLATVRNGALNHEPDTRLHTLLERSARRPRLMPMVQNATADGAWDGAGTARMLADERARYRFVRSLIRMVEAEGGHGVMLDLENLPRAAHIHYRRLLSDLRVAFAPRGWWVAIAAPVGDPDWDLAAYADAADRVVLMAYDEHWMGGSAGPIASQPWFARVVAQAVAAIGREKAIVAIGNYAYDWNGTTTEPLTVSEAWTRAVEASAVPIFDRMSGNAHFAYRIKGRDHQVWMLDAISATNQLRLLDDLGVAQVALWRLGSEDPGFWAALHGNQAGLEVMPALAGVTVRGSGEVMRLDGEAAPGARELQVGSDGLIDRVRYVRLPSADTIQRTGAQRRMIALTFDDGPDPAWTPQILDILRREHAPATFFVTGTNAIGQGALLRRIVAEGSELGNHSTSHANLARRSPAAIRLELTATERVVEAYTGRSMRLFRPPFLGDADPDRSDELHATRVAAALGYLTVGLNVDPLDWRAPGATKIVASTLAQVDMDSQSKPRRIVLLHDSGGDRGQTIAALPAIIRGLRDRGYTLVPVSTLAGLERDAAMPPLTGISRRHANGSRLLFDGIASLRDGLMLLFATAIAIGIARAILLAALAMIEKGRETSPAHPPHLVPPLVSVLIPAFNEARVIEASVRRILASTSVRIEVIVIDDGSTDETSHVVTRAFGIDPRVRLLRLKNGGKARALNTALAKSKGDVVVALDADTEFEPDTVAKLTAWFGDMRIGAVAGNARIGNPVNLITRWQSVEYVSAQNIERRALAILGAVTVVPGAVGAWRRRALDEVGGYPEDTLAEDQDLTIAIQRAGWKVVCDNDAVAWTEAPETAQALFRQRFRWAYGTLQCLWKHRGLIGRGRPHGLALFGLPQAILFQMLLTVIAPLIDLTLIASIVGTCWRLADRGWGATGDDAITMGAFWLAFTAVELAFGWLAFRLDAGAGRFPAARMLAQRFGYRQLL